MNLFLKMADSFFDLLYPRKCFFCGVLSGCGVKFDHQICDDCRSEIETNQNYQCTNCFMPLPSESFSVMGRCPGCAPDNLPVKGIVSISEYGPENPIGDIILAMKHSNRPDLAKSLGCILSDRIRKRMPYHHFDCVTAVPLHRTRMKKRGYNQAGLIAFNLARRLNLPFYPWLLQRMVKTAPQSGSPEARLKNIEGAFKAGGVCDNANVILVDDVYTTGATAKECSKILWQAGADGVYIAVIAWVPKLFAN